MIDNMVMGGGKGGKKQTVEKRKIKMPIQFNL